MPPGLISSFTVDSPQLKQGVSCPWSHLYKESDVHYVWHKCFCQCSLQSWANQLFFLKSESKWNSSPSCGRANPQLLERRWRGQDRTGQDRGRRPIRKGKSVFFYLLLPSGLKKKVFFTLNLAEKEMNWARLTLRTLVYICRKREGKNPKRFSRQKWYVKRKEKKTFGQGISWAPIFCMR